MQTQTPMDLTKKGGSSKVPAPSFYKERNEKIVRLLDLHLQENRETFRGAVRWLLTHWTKHLGEYKPLLETSFFSIYAHWSGEKNSREDWRPSFYKERNEKIISLLDSRIEKSETFRASVRWLLASWTKHMGECKPLKEGAFFHIYAYSGGKRYKSRRTFKERNEKIVELFKERKPKAFREWAKSLSENWHRFFGEEMAGLTPLQIRIIVSRSEVYKERKKVQVAEREKMFRKIVELIYSMSLPTVTARVDHLVSNWEDYFPKKKPMSAGHLRFIFSTNQNKRTHEA